MTGQGPRESNERLEVLGDSVLGLVTSEFLYRQHPDEHEGQLTKTKSLLVSKAILSRRALAMGLGRFVLMSHSEVESGGRQRLSILADAFEAVIGAVYLDQGFEAARGFIHRWLLKDTQSIAADERHANYKSHLQEYVQSTFHTHPVYRIRSEYGPDHSKHFMVDVLVGKRPLGSGRGRNKKEAEQAAARDALEQVGAMRGSAERPAESRGSGERAAESRGAPGFRMDHGISARPERRTEAPREEEAAVAQESVEPEIETEAGPADAPRSRRRGRRGGRGRRGRGEGLAPTGAALADEAGIDDAEAGESRESREPAVVAREVTERPSRWRRLDRLDEELEEVGRPEGPLEERHVDPYDWEGRRRERAADSVPDQDAGRSEPASEPVEDGGMTEAPAPAPSADVPPAAPAPRADTARYGRRTRPRH